MTANKFQVTDEGIAAVMRRLAIEEMATAALNMRREDRPKVKVPAPTWAALARIETPTAAEVSAEIDRRLNEQDAAFAVEGYRQEGQRLAESARQRNDELHRWFNYGYSKAREDLEEWLSR